MCLTKMAQPTQECPKVICQGLSWVIFKGELLNLLYDSDPWSWVLKSCFSSLRLILGVVSIRRVLVILQKTKNISFAIFVRCHLWWVLFLWGGIFDNIVAMDAINVGRFSHFDRTSLLDISGYVTWPSHVL